MKERYNIYLISTDTFKAVELIESNVGKEESIHIEMVRGARYDAMNFFVQGYMDGSERDSECRMDLKRTVRFIR